MRKKQRKEKLEKASGYYPPEPIYNSISESEVPILGKGSDPSSSAKIDQKQVTKRERKE